MAGKFRQWLKDRRAIATVEFALILPILLAMLFGVIELTHALIVQRKVTAAAQGLADLVGTYGVGQNLQPQSMSDADFTNIRTAADWLMSPFPGGSRLRYGIAHVSFYFDASRGNQLTPSINNNTNGNQEGGWTENQGLTGNPPAFFRASATTAGTALYLAMTRTTRQGQTAQGAGALGQGQDAIIIVRFEYDYQPIIGRLSLPGIGLLLGGGTFTMSDIAYSRPRLVRRIGCAATSPHCRAYPSS